MRATILAMFGALLAPVLVLVLVLMLRVVSVPAHRRCCPNARTQTYGQSAIRAHHWHEAGRNRGAVQQSQQQRQHDCKPRPRCHSGMPSHTDTL